MAELTWNVDGRDWPAIDSGLDPGEVIEALAAITDEDVAAATASLLDAGPEQEVL